MKKVRLLSWNVNGLRAAHKELLLAAGLPVGCERV